MDDFNYDDMRKLEPGRKYTLVSFSEFGFPYQIQFVLKGMRYEPYAQYKESYCMIYRQPRQRQDRMIRFYGIKQYIIWEGWVYPKTDMYGSPRVNNYPEGQVTVRESWQCFDARYMQRALATVSQAPFIQNLRVPDVMAADVSEVGRQVWQDAKITHVVDTKLENVRRTMLKASGFALSVVRSPLLTAGSAAAV